MNRDEANNNISRNSRKKREIERVHSFGRSEKSRSFNVWRAKRLALFDSLTGSAPLLNWRLTFITWSLWDVCAFAFGWPRARTTQNEFFLEEAKTCPESFLRDTSTLLASQTAQRNSVPFSLGLVLTAWNLFLPLSDLKKSCTKELILACGFSSTIILSKYSLQRSTSVQFNSN